MGLNFLHKKDSETKKRMFLRLTRPASTRGGDLPPQPIWRAEDLFSEQRNTSIAIEIGQRGCLNRCSFKCIHKLKDFKNLNYLSNLQEQACRSNPGPRDQSPRASKRADMQTLFISVHTTMLPSCVHNPEHRLIVNGSQTAYHSTSSRWKQTAK